MSHRVATDPDAIFACGRVPPNCGIASMPAIYPSDAHSVLMNGRILDSPVFHANASSGRPNGHVVNGHTLVDHSRSEPAAAYDNLIDLSPSRRHASSNDDNVVDATVQRRMFESLPATIPYGLVSQATGGGALSGFISTTAWHGIAINL
jgi:hypothetical protein